MFESAELGHKVDDATFKKQEPKLREALLDAQFDVYEAKKFPVVLVVAGIDTSGRSETINALLSWMDAHHIQVHALDRPTDEELARPRMWRFWRDLPAKGKTGIFIGGWYTEAITDRVYGRIKKAEFEQRLGQIRAFERLLTDDGALLVKVWIHLSKDRQQKRLKKLASSPLTRWRVSEAEWANLKHYGKIRKHAEHALRQTSNAAAPWLVIEGTDSNYRTLTAGQELLGAMRRRLERLAHVPTKGDRRAATTTSTEVSSAKGPDTLNVLSALDLKKPPMKKDDYDTRLEKLQGRLSLLTRHKRFDSLGVVAMFEGSDAAGKGGTIRRVTEALDARLYRVTAVAAPTEEERAQPYLWRFWRQLPMRGRFSIFDRSWYGRVLVERVEGFAGPGEWQRAFAEINDFESQLREARVVLCKFWLQIDPDEQLKRFREREKVGFKRYKITDEDWRNRNKWDAYQVAACEMIERTSTEEAPWTLVESNDKHHARIKVLQTLCDHIEDALDK